MSEDAENNPASKDLAGPKYKGNPPEAYRFKPGQSGNPLGRSSVLSSEIKRLTGGGVEMAHVMIQIMRGQKIEGIWGSPTYKDVREAAQWLAERSFGTAPLNLDGAAGNYDLQRILLIELTKKKEEPGVFTIAPESLESFDHANNSPSELRGQDLALDPPVQDPLEGSGDHSV